MERENEQNTKPERQYITVIPQSLLNSLFKGTQEKYYNRQKVQLNELLLRHRPQRGPPALLTLAIGMTRLLFNFSSIRAERCKYTFHGIYSVLANKF